VFVTPIPSTPNRQVVRAEQFWKRIGAKVLRWTPGDHDRRVALTSHVPHLLACVMMELYGRRRVKDRALEAAVGPGFKDFTRIAAGNPAMWTDIMKLNAKEIGSVLGDFRKSLQMLEKDLKLGRRDKWMRFFENARTLREKIR
jgi:prephenate dehydrogenase